MLGQLLASSTALVKNTMPTFVGLNSNTDPQSNGPLNVEDASHDNVHDEINGEAWGNGRYLHDLVQHAHVEFS